MVMRLPRPRHGDPIRTTAELRDLAAAVLEEDVQTLARTTAYLRRSYRAVFLAYLAMLVFGLAAVIAAFVKGMQATTVGEAIAAVGLSGLTVGAVFRPLPARRRRVMGHPLGPLRPIFWRTT